MRSYLDFEKPVAELEAKVEARTLDLSRANADLAGATDEGLRRLAMAVDVCHDGEEGQAVALRDLFQAGEVAADFALDVVEAALRRAGEFDLPARLNRQAVHLPGVHLDRHQAGVGCRSRLLNAARWVTAKYLSKTRPTGIPTSWQTVERGLQPNAVRVHRADAVDEVVEADRRRKDRITTPPDNPGLTTRGRQPRVVAWTRSVSTT